MIDVSSELANLNAVNITWRTPPDNNAPITDYILDFCDLSPNNSTCVDNNTISRSVSDLTRVSATHLSYLFEPPLPLKQYEVVIRAENSVGPQTAPILGGGYRFNSAFESDGQVVNISVIPTTSVVILTWSLPQLAMAASVTTDFFRITYFDQRRPASMETANVSYSSSSQDQPGFSVSIAPVGGHTFSITATYSTPRLTSSPATVTDVRLLEEGK